MNISALPILRQLGAQGGTSGLRTMLRSGDYSMIKVWAGLEARRFFTVSVEEVSLLMLSFKHSSSFLTHSRRSIAVSSMTNCRPIYNESCCLDSRSGDRGGGSAYGVDYVHVRHICEGYASGEMCKRCNTEDMIYNKHDINT